MPINPAVLINAVIESGVVDAETVGKLQVRSRRERQDLLELIAHHARFPMAAFYQALADVRGLPFLARRDLTPDAKLLVKLPESVLQRQLIVPLREEHGEILVAVPDPDDRAGLEVARRIFGRPLKLAIAEPEALMAALRVAGQRTDRTAPAGAVAQEFDSIAVLDRIFRQAYLCRASDIHFEPYQHGMRIRSRVDGQLQDYPIEFTSAEGVNLLSRIKVLSGLDIAEQREPQDGSMSYTLPPPADQQIDVRVATVPTRWGERMTLRLLGMDTQNLTLEQLGMSSQALDHFRRVIERPHGMILITGPTGSGKSTTLYAALREINHPELNIMTVEDPVEYAVDGLAQIQVSSKVSFAGALRSLLRHDPDVLMLGEIRDQETADVALKAALTGHLVFSTLHTNDAASAVTRLTDIGAQRFLIASTLVAVIAQRLVRRLCQRCATRRATTTQEAAYLGVDEDGCDVFDATGCANCLGTGYRGRLGLFETLWVDAPVADCIAANASEREILAAANSCTTLWADGRAKVRAGLTSLAELRRVVVSAH